MKRFQGPENEMKLVETTELLIVLPNYDFALTFEVN